MAHGLGQPTQMTATARIPRLFQRLADVPGGAGLQVHKLLSQVLEALTLSR